jgi:hypothetical protein
MLRQDSFLEALEVDVPVACGEAEGRPWQHHRLLPAYGGDRRHRRNCVAREVLLASIGVRRREGT